MRAGAMRERVAIQAEVTDGVDLAWGTSKAFVEQVRVWASVKAEGGGEAVEGQGVQGRTTYTVRIRYREGVTSRNRLVLRDGRLLDVLSVVDPTGKKHELELKAIERQEAA